MNKITLTGDLGSGKSAVSALLCTQTGYEYLSTGRVQRQLAQEMGMDTLEMNRRADWDPSIDEKIDGVFRQINHDPKGYVLDSRLAWFFVQPSFKVYLQVDPHVAAARILSDPARNSEQYADLEEAVTKIKARKVSENARFLSKYGADCADMHQFDIVIDTTHRTLASVAALIVESRDAHIAGVPFMRYW